MRTAFAMTSMIALSAAALALGAYAVPDDAESLAKVLRTLLPAKGWDLAIVNDQVVLERNEKVALFNGVSLPGFKTEQERREYVKPHLRHEQLKITLWLGTRMDAEEVERTRIQNQDVYDRIRKDKGQLKFNPNAKFLKDHPEYQIKRLPILDTGNKSIYMDCPLDCIAPPNTVRGARIIEFWDENVEQECQGIIDRLGKQFTPY